MTLLRTKDIRAMSEAERAAKLRELQDELMHERGVAAMGGAPRSPGKLRALRTNIARILTIESERRRQGAAEEKKSVTPATPRPTPTRVSEEA